MFSLLVYKTCQRQPFLLNLRHCVKSYGHLSQIYQSHSPNVVMSRDPGFNAILQCTLVYTEYTVQSISVLQIYTYLESTILLHTDNILSTLSNNLAQSFSVHWSLWNTLSGIYLFTKSLHILQ